MLLYVEEVMIYNKFYAQPPYDTATGTPLPSLPRVYNGSLARLMMNAYIVDLAPDYVPQVTSTTSGIKF
jgi:hypothetical protein